MAPSARSKEYYKSVEYAGCRRGLLPFVNKKSEAYIFKHMDECEYDIWIESFAYQFTTSNGVEFGARFIENDATSEYCYAYPNLSRYNQSDTCIDDGYLVIISQEGKQIEIIVFEGCRGIMNCIYTLYSYGFYNEEIWQLRKYND
jgi:hypothetical protein